MVALAMFFCCWRVAARAQSSAHQRDAEVSVNQKQRPPCALKLPTHRQLAWRAVAVRRLLDTDFAHVDLGETPQQFTKRLKRVENFMNSDKFAKADHGRGLLGLAKALPDRCKLVIKEKGARIPK